MPRALRLAIFALGLALTANSCARGVTGPRDDTWRFMPGHVESMKIAAFRGGRQCWVYLPPGYGLTDRRYPVLYLNDGENALDISGGMHVDRVAQDLIRRGGIEPLIIVAISSGPPGQRFMDYTPWVFFRTSYPTGGGEFYLRAVRDTLKPEVDRRYRTRPDRGNTGMAGESLGGLISAFALFAHDSTFGKTAAFSPTYGFGGFAEDIFAVARHPSAPVRFYQDTGTDYDNSIARMEAQLTQLGFVLGQDFMSVTATGGDHGPGSWAHRMPDMLRFLFPPQSPAP